ncbi:patatin-like phospholipase family protein [Phenylobacterium sp. LH3H17]|uniref:patatin-like phospholipase family protein n=1 Tax=Phenylobacterium sp. LH3H17 TaxID=2903901 RepID=UPI0020C9412C|nr:patatin-like phospholipase family protein [Phenylobacterium sp. LH3H17]UTP41380.1 patatin-like phospholipase family protein [Phenylobacterium sp. LH3H17]
MATLPDIPSDSALARLFNEERAQGDATWFSLPGGATLYKAGEPADHLYLVRAGRLGAFRREEGGETQFLGVIRPGEPAGEMSLIAGAPHSAQVVALRDSEIYALPRDVFFEACDTDGSVMIELAKLMILRSRQAATKASVGVPSVFGFVCLGEPTPLRAVVDKIAREIGRLGYTVTVVGAEAQNAPTEWFSGVERDYEVVLYVAEAGDQGWRQVVGRQVDRLFRVGKGDTAPPKDGVATEPLQAQHLVDLILIQKKTTQTPRGSEAWVAAAKPARLFHLRRDNSEDIKRIARVLTGQSVGLVLSGGGARAYAHVGAINALRERGVPIDFVGGSSMGAIIGAGLALGWQSEEMDLRIRDAFVNTSPLDDIALPLLAMTHGGKVKERLAQHFGDTHIADLWLPFFCVSSDLTTGTYHLHKSGLLRDALRASIALPGVMPPATTEDDHVLVDGAVMKNFPADVMRISQIGPIVGVDVSRGRSIMADDVARPASVWRWLWSGDWRKGPPIVSLLMRAATVSTGRDLAAAREATDVLITPDVTGVEIRDWSAYDPAVAAGYKATLEALDKLTLPVTELRQRASDRNFRK